MNQALHHKTLTELSQYLQKKTISSTELTQYFIKRIKKANNTLNAFIHISEANALEQAKQADKRIAKGTASNITGIPIAHKDIFCTQGIPTSCASKMLHAFIPPYNATIVTNCNEAGMVMLGKTNMDEFAMGSSNENSYYGPVKNPWDLTRTPGGSSGGSASAIAARLTPAATGTDTGGSIRQPAALSGITGLKPTYGCVSRYGMIAFASSLDQAGPMTQTAEDAALLLNVMAGYDPKDSTSIHHPTPNYATCLSHSVKDITIGLPTQYFTNHLDPRIAQAMEATRHTLEKLGAQFIDIELPLTQFASAVYYVLAPAEASSNLARYDGIRFGYQCDAPKNLEDLYTRSRTEGFGPEVKRRIMVGTHVLSSGYYHAYYLKAQQVRRLIRDEFKKALKAVDLILTPSTPTPAFPLGEKTTDPIKMYSSDIFTVASSLAGLPAIAFPAGFSNHLPIGAQLIGNYFNESKLLNVTHRFQQATNWHQALPPIAEDL